MNYFNAKNYEMARLIKEIEATHMRIQREIKSLFATSESEVVVVNETLTVVNRELQKLIDFEINTKQNEIKLFQKYTPDQMSMFRTKLYESFVREITSNPLWTYEKLRDKYGDVIAKIRDSGARDRMYMPTVITDIKRGYIQDVHLTFLAKESVSAVGDKLNIQLQNSGLYRHGHTIINTNLLNVYREQEDVIRQDANLQYGTYYGGIRATTRDFCLQNVGVTRKWTDWVDMVNDIGDSDITVYAGGYNCSHRVFATDERLAEEAEKTLNKTYGKTIEDKTAYKEKLLETQNNALTTTT